MMRLCLVCTKFRQIRNGTFGVRADMCQNASFAVVTAAIESMGRPATRCRPHQSVASDFRPIVYAHVTATT